MEKKITNKTKKYVVVRGDRSGVFFGILGKRKNQETTLLNARKIFYWEGAGAVEELAVNGVGKPQNCKFTVWVEEITITDAIQVLPCTQKAIESLSAVNEWKLVNN